MQTTSPSPSSKLVSRTLLAIGFPSLGRTETLPLGLARISSAHSCKKVKPVLLPSTSFLQHASFHSRAHRHRPFQLPVLIITFQISSVHFHATPSETLLFFPPYLYFASRLFCPFFMPLKITHYTYHLSNSPPPSSARFHTTLDRTLLAFRPYNYFHISSAHFHATLQAGQHTYHPSSLLSLPFYRLGIIEMICPYRGIDERFAISDTRRRTISLLLSTPLNSLLIFVATFFIPNQP